MVVIGRDGIFRAIGPAWQDVFGYAPEAVTGRSFAEFIHPDDEAATREALTSAADGNDLTNFINRYRHADGSARWISWHTSVEGDLVYAYGRDISREKQAVEALATSKARLRAIFETSHQFQGLLDCSGMVLDANSTSLQAINATLADVVGKPFWDTPWFTKTAGMSAMIQAVIPTAALGVTIRQEICVDLPVGGWRWFDFVIRPMRDKQGAVVALIPEAMETTERKKAEEALHQVQKLEAMGQLTGGVAHDFNNLLTPIVATLDMLRRRGVGGEREQRLIAAAAQSADRARTLVHRLLAFARRQPLQPVPVDVGNLIVGMAELIRRTSGPQIDVQVEIEEGAIVALADPNQLEMALLNLSVNARDAMSQGGVLKITAANEIAASDLPSELKPGHYVRISVLDTGIGMDEETLAHAIEPFFSTKGIGKGTGLGLSMAHGLASQLGGALRISSEPGLGTEIEFWIPASSEAIPRRTEAPPKAQRTGPVGTALLVDDEEFVRLSTADMLGEMGFAVFEASSAQEALMAIEGGLKIDVLVTDHLMPGPTGVDLIAELRRRWPSLPVLIISGFAEAEGIPPDLPRLTKPFRQEELAGALTHLLETT
jgi:PAS domain S-box-containing protein